jgi:uncharacterized membrane protein YbaN (DUF454 family)
VKLWNDPIWVGRTPIVTSILIDGGAIGQIVRMWSEKTAEGQSLISWAAVLMALVLWANFYRVITPDQKWARITILISIFLNIGVVGSVILWRYVL